MPAIPNPGYLPEVMRNNNGANAGVVLQNPHGWTQDLLVNYWSIGYTGSEARNVASRKVEVIYPAPSDQAQPPPPDSVVASAQATSGSGLPAVVNLLFLPLAFLSGLWVPVQVLPALLQKLAPALPPYHFSQLALGQIGAATGPSPWISILYLTLFAALSLALALVGYRRDEGKTYG